MRLRLRLNLHVRELTLLDFALASCDRKDAIIASSYQDSDIEYLVSECREYKTRIPLRCAALLEVDAPPFEEISMSDRRSSTYAELLHYQFHSKVSFIHATAYDFLLNDEKGTTFLNTDFSMDVHRVAQLFKAQLVRLRLLSCSYIKMQLSRPDLGSTLSRAGDLLPKRSD